MTNHYNGKLVVSISVGLSKKSNDWTFQYKRFFGLMKNKRRWVYWTDCFSSKSEKYFGWENDNHERYIKGDDIYTYPWVSVKFVNNDSIFKRFETDQEAKNYCEKLKLKSFDSMQYTITIEEK